MMSRMEAITTGLLMGVMVGALHHDLRAEGDGLTQRQGEIVAGITRYAPWDCPDRWLYELGDVSTRNDTLRKAMLDKVSWIDFLALANALDWGREEARKTLDVLVERFSEITSGKVRQNVLFLIALTAVDAEARLEPVFAGKIEGVTEEDRNDAGCALAALGNQKATTWLIEEFKSTEAFFGRPVFKFPDYRKEESDEKNRLTVRSYRFWEVIFRRPYYRRLQFLARAGIYRMTAQDLGDTARDQLSAKLLPVFISKWLGHPGSDNVAQRMMHYAVQGQDLRVIYTWAQRASLLPDQDCAESSVHILTALADSQLSTEDLDALLQSEDGKQNREFLLYERFIKTARKDIEAGLSYFDKVAKRDASSVFAQARRRAAKEAPSPAMRDGRLQELTLKIMLDYPKRSKGLGETVYKPEEKATEDEYLGLLTSREREIVLRTRLQRTNSVSVDAGALAKQYRLLLELKHLQELEVKSDDPEAKADLRYRQAKMLYRESRILFPVWEREVLNAGYRLNSVRYDAAADQRLEDYVSDTFALRRAFRLFESLRKDYPDYDGMDLVLFHMGHCYAKLMDYRPAKAVAVWSFPDRPPAGTREGRLEYAHRRVGELFQTLLDKHPESDWAAKVEQAAQYHFKRAEILRTKREKAERGRGINEQRV